MAANGGRYGRENIKGGHEQREIWKDIYNYEGYYQVSNLGNVKSLDRIIVRCDGIRYKQRGNLLSPTLNSDGYLQVHLSKNGKTKTFSVHILVANAFLKRNNCNDEVKHIDCNRQNNVVDNLEYLSHAENVRYAIACGNHVCTRDLTKANNPNYGNHTLKNFYRENPDVAKALLSRPGECNGRAKPVVMYMEEGQAEFGYIGECATFLITGQYTQKSFRYVCDCVSAACRNNKQFLGFTFQFK